MRHEIPIFRLGQTVAYRERLYRIISAEVMGLTGWRYNIDDGQGHKKEYVYSHELTAVKSAEDVS